MLKRSLSINNSVLHRYLRNCDLAHLLQDGQDIEEHLLECASLKLHIQNDNVPLRKDTSKRRLLYVVFERPILVP